MANPESPNIWQSKPWWCQPWSIVLTGLGIISASWLVGQSLWLTVAIALPILAWWGLFLILVPQAYANGDFVIPPMDREP